MKRREISEYKKIYWVLILLFANSIIWRVTFIIQLFFVFISNEITVTMFSAPYALSDSGLIISTVMMINALSIHDVLDTSGYFLKAKNMYFLRLLSGTISVLFEGGYSYLINRNVIQIVRRDDLFLILAFFLVMDAFIFPILMWRSDRYLLMGLEEVWVACGGDDRALRSAKRSKRLLVASLVFYMSGTAWAYTHILYSSSIFIGTEEGTGGPGAAFYVSLILLMIGVLLWLVFQFQLIRQAKKTADIVKALSE